MSVAPAPGFFDLSGVSARFRAYFTPGAITAGPGCKYRPRPLFCSNGASFKREKNVIDRALRIAQVLALLWIGYELHGLANPEVENPDVESTVDSAAVVAPRL